MPGGGVVHAPADWIAEWADLPADLDPRALADALIRVGLEVEKVESAGDALSGPIVVGRVVTAEPEPQKNGKTINWCTVDVGEHNTDVAEPHGPEPHGPEPRATEPRGIVCGAHNFGPGDLVVVALPGAVLPGGFAISARKTYGHVSDGMICSVRELGIGDASVGSHGSQAPRDDGILVLDPDAALPGDDALDVLGLRDAVLDIAVTPDRGYALSMRGLAREAAGALGVGFRDVADAVTVPAPDADGPAVRIDDVGGCDRFSARVVTGLDPAAPSPDWMRRRLTGAGVRAISLAVDVTNYVMLETGQPLHAFDLGAVRGPIVVRRARAGETLTTLDDAERRLDPEDLVVTDDSGPIGLGGVMGGASTEITPSTTRILLEAAHWNPSSIARTVRRHRLPSEAAKRFERGVDPEIAAVALQRCVDLLVAHGGATAAPGFTVVGEPVEVPAVRLRVAHAGELAGRPVPREAVVGRLTEVGCHVEPDGDELRVRPPTWRPDLTGPAELIEEILRLEGYDTIPSALPTPPPGRGLSAGQMLHRAVSRAIAAAGYAEVLSSPFLAPGVFDHLGLPADDPRRQAVRLVNPLSEAEPLLRTTLLPGLFATVARNLGRGLRDLALSETGRVFFPPAPGAPPVPRPDVSGRPSEAEIAALDASLPVQPNRVAVVLTGRREQPGWWGPGRPAQWSDALEAARSVARAARVGLAVQAADLAPWHPGRCAALLLDGVVIGHAGELHPRVVGAFGLPERTCAMEIDLDAFAPPAPATTPVLSTYPPVLLDVALVVGADVPAAAVEAALRAGAGTVDGVSLEALRLFDVFADADRLGADLRSLAYSLRLRAADRTLTVEEATRARDAAVSEATTRVGARLRA